MSAEATSVFPAPGSPVIYVGPVTRLRGTGRRESFDMERGAGGGAGERTLEQAFEQGVGGGRALEQDVRAARERVTRARTGVQAARNPGRERERVSEGGPDTGHRTAHACMRNSNSDISQIASA